MNLSSKKLIEDDDSLSTRSDEELFDVRKGMLIKKFKISNLAGVLILLAADLGIGFFTLPQYFSLNTLWCKH